MEALINYEVYGWSEVIMKTYLNILLAIMFFSGCATGKQSSPADQIKQYKRQFVGCKNKAISKYIIRSNDLYLVRKSVLADCGHYLDQVDNVFRANYWNSPNARAYWENILEDEIGKASLQKQEGSKLERGMDAYATNDYQTAFSQLQPLAKNGDGIAQVILGHMYVNGFGVPKNDNQAVTWYRQSAKQGNDSGQYNLGVMYAVGAGVSQNNIEASRWLELSAEQGHKDAQIMLGQFYRIGKGVSQNSTEALKWQIIAQGNGADIGGAIETTENNMTEDEISEAQKLAREWMEKHNR
jgi:TPR repeat protein